MGFTVRSLVGVEHSRGTTLAGTVRECVRLSEGGCPCGQNCFYSVRVVSVPTDVERKSHVYIYKRLRVAAGSWGRVFWYVCGLAV